MTWKPCPACLCDSGVDYLGRAGEYFAVCSRCRYILAKGQTVSETALEYSRRYRVIE